jgi:hypothetical protein
VLAGLERAVKLDDERMALKDSSRIRQGFVKDSSRIRQGFVNARTWTTNG